MIRKQVKQFGFTLIEMIVSLALFSVVITISVGALLMLLATNDQLQGEQSVMTNLSFALDSMTREIRTGTYYYCVTGSSQSGVFADSSDVDSYHGNSKSNCTTDSNANYIGISFKEAGNSITGSAERIMYFYDRPEKKIYRKVGNQAAQSIVSDGIVIEDMNIYVSDTNQLYDDNDDRQPTATFFIEAKATDDDVSHYVQTTVTQRTLDI